MLRLALLQSGSWTSPLCVLRLAVLQSGSWTSPLCVFDVTERFLDQPIVLFDVTGTVTERFLDQPIVCV